jgi:hypothetical protein
VAFLHPTYVLAKHHVRFHQLEGLANLLKTVAKHGLNELGFSQSIEAVPENRLSSHIFFALLAGASPPPSRSSSKNLNTIDLVSLTLKVFRPESSAARSTPV